MFKPMSHAHIGHHPSMPKLAVLAVAAASREPISGKAFTEKIDALTQGAWHISPGLVYPLLRKMEEEELLKCGISDASGDSVAHCRGRRELAYALTAKGTAFLKDARRDSREHLNKMMARMVPLSAFVFFGDDDPEFLEAMKKVRASVNERVWRAAGFGKEKRLRELRKLLEAIEKA